jgi:hypothetical protein
MYRKILIGLAYLHITIMIPTYAMEQTTDPTPKGTFSIFKRQQQCKKRLERCMNALVKLRNLQWTEAEKPGRCQPVLDRCLLLLKPTEEEDLKLYKLFKKAQAYKRNLEKRKTIRQDQEKLEVYFDEFLLRDVLDSGERYEITLLLSEVENDLRGYHDQKVKPLNFMQTASAHLGEIMRIVSQAILKKGKSLSLHYFDNLIPKFMVEYARIVEKEFGFVFTDSSLNSFLEELAHFTESYGYQKEFQYFQERLTSCEANQFLWQTWKLAQFIDEKNQSTSQRAEFIHSLKDYVGVYCNVGKQTSIHHLLTEVVLKALELN